jgi:polyisoprenoid-binding protein YceI
LLVLSVATAAFAAPETFDFKDPKGVNNASFKLDAPLEAVNGTAAGVSGTVSFDPENPAATTGKIVVASSSLQLANAMQQQHMRGAQWLDVANHPEISFEATAMKNVKTSGDTTTADVTGTFSLKGVSREMTVPVKMTYLKDKLSQRFPQQKGDLLVIRSTFTIKRSDFNIMPGQMEDKVSNEIEIGLSIAGAAQK